MRAAIVATFALVVGCTLTACSTPPSTAAISEPKPDGGLVVFYRPSAMKGAAIRFEITEEGVGSIGTLSNGAVLERDLEPGSHTFTVRAPSVDGRDSVTVNVDVGATYFVKGTILWGWPAGRPKFTLMSESQARAELARMSR
ncbi:MAG: hypothetical protein ACYTGC_18415 [Planctomycetota bacterium]|jgi:hypothetical protein